MYCFPLRTVDIRLFSPQTYHQMHNFSSTITAKQVVMHLKDHNIVIPIDSGPSNLPIVWNPSVSAAEQREICLNFVSKLEFCDLPGVSSMFHVPLPLFMDNTFHRNSWEGVWLDLICPCIGTTENTNLSDPQRELLTCHWNLGVSMQQI